MADKKIGPKSGLSKPVFIYALRDPRDWAIRYIGKTENVVQRVRLHMAEARKGGTTHKSRWLRLLMRQGLKPLVGILEIVPAGESWPEAERRHIAEHKARGARLVNRTDGGDAAPDSARTPEALAKAVATRRANPAYRKAMLAAAARRRGIPHSDETKAKMSATRKGRKFPPEFGAKISAAQKGRPANPKSIEGSRRAKLGSKESEETKQKKRVAMEKHRESQSARQRANWADPEYRERVTANMTGRDTSESARKNLSTGVAKSWSDETIRKKRTVGLRANAERPAWREKRREIAKRLWADPDFRARMTDARTRSKEENK